MGKAESKRPAGSFMVQRGQHMQAQQLADLQDSKKVHAASPAWPQAPPGGLQQACLISLQGNHNKVKLPHQLGH